MSTTYARKVTEKTFKAIKILLESKTPGNEIAEYMGISTATVSYIKSAETFQDYLDFMAAKKAKQKKAIHAKTAEKEAEPQKMPEPVPQIVEHRQSVTLMANHYLMEEVKTQTELLKTISAKLAFIVDELTK